VVFYYHGATLASGLTRNYPGTGQAIIDYPLREIVRYEVPAYYVAEEVRRGATRWSAGFANDDSMPQWERDLWVIAPEGDETLGRFEHCVSAVPMLRGSR
jgi:hypothetical protein